MFKVMNCQTQLGKALQNSCPENDCMIYRNIFNMYEALVEDREKAQGIVSEYAMCAIESAILKNLRELDKMYFENVAVQIYLQVNYERK